MNHDYWGPPTPEEIEEEKLQKKYRDKVDLLLHRNAGYFKVNELLELSKLSKRCYYTSFEQQLIDEIDFLTRNRDLGES